PGRTRTRMGIADAQDARRAVHLKVGKAVTPDSKAGGKGCLSPALELDQRREKCIGADLERLAGPRAAHSCPLWKQDAGHAGNSAHRAQQADHGGHVVRTDIEQRTAAWLVEEGGVEMPAL